MCCSHDSLLLGQSALPSLPNYHQCTAHVPPFSIIRKKLHFQPYFRPKFQLSRCKISEFLLWRPLIFQGSPLPRPYFWKPAQQILPKKVKCPLGNDYYMYLTESSFYFGMVECFVLSLQVWLFHFFWWWHFPGVSRFPSFHLRKDYRGFIICQVSLFWDIQYNPEANCLRNSKTLSNFQQVQLFLSY